MDYLGTWKVLTKQDLNKIVDKIERNKASVFTEKVLALLLKLIKKMGQNRKNSSKTEKLRKIFVQLSKH